MFSLTLGNIRAIIIQCYSRSHKNARSNPATEHRDAYRNIIGRPQEIIRMSSELEFEPPHGRICVSRGAGNTRRSERTRRVEIITAKSPLVIRPHENIPGVHVRCQIRRGSGDHDQTLLNLPLKNCVDRPAKKKKKKLHADVMMV